MIFSINNTGIISKAEIEFGDLTILCGKNNTEKTYITYNAFNYIDAIRYFLKIPVDKQYAETLLEKGKISLPLDPFFRNINEYIKSSMSSWEKDEIFRQMAAHEDLYKNTTVSLFIERERQDSIMDFLDFKWTFQITKESKLDIVKEKNKRSLDIMLSNSAPSLPETDIIIAQLESIIQAVIKVIIPDLFIITCERTGVAAFRSDFVVSREAFLRQANASRTISSQQNDEEQVINELYQKMDFRGHPRPMNKDLEFVCRFDETIQNKGFIAKEHPEILKYFSQIVGGEYHLSEPNVVKFVPTGTNIGLTMLESSSSVRSLMELNFYLKHKSKSYQCLIIDEPELNLHPENQRRIARLLARLVNAGIYVAITTHSDYIIKEINTLLMLNYDDPRMKEMQKKYGYSKDELLKAESLRVYCAEEGTVKQVKVSQDVGISISGFDETIRQMGKMQRDILYGEQ